jgi:hypothetical protein
MAFLATRGLGKGQSAGFMSTFGLGRGQEEIIIPPGGGGSVGSGVSHFNQAPNTKVKKRPIMLAQAKQEDEELIMIIKAFVETVRWH